MSGKERKHILRNTKLPQIKPHHLRLDLDLVEFFPAVDPNHAPNHLGHDNHVPQVCLDEIWLLIRLGFLLRFPQLFDQAHGFALQAAVEAAARARVDYVPELLGGEVEESVE